MSGCILSGCIFGVDTRRGAFTCADGTCPDGLLCVDETEQCVPADNGCVQGHAGDVTVRADGASCNQGVCLKGACVAVRCGDGIRSEGEDCDDGNGDDTDSCTTTCVAARCGDSLVAVASEACDDGNNNDGDGCRGDCNKIERCGDAIIDANEACDDGNNNSLDGCDQCQRDAWSADLLFSPGVDVELSTKASVLTGEGNVNDVAVDHLGNLYFSHGTRRQIFRMTPEGLVQPFAGTGAAGSTGDGGPATSATLTAPSAVAADTIGNILIADPGACRIRRVSIDGNIETLAGNGCDTAFDPTATGAATAVHIRPVDVAVNGQGQVLFAENTATVRALMGDSIVVVAGEGAAPDRAFAGEARLVAMELSGRSYFVTNVANNGAVSGQFSALPTFGDPSQIFAVDETGSVIAPLEHVAGCLACDGFGATPQEALLAGVRWVVPLGGGVVQWGNAGFVGTIEGGTSEIVDAGGLGFGAFNLMNGVFAYIGNDTISSGTSFNELQNINKINLISDLQNSLSVTGFVPLSYTVDGDFLIDGTLGLAQANDRETTLLAANFPFTNFGLLLPRYRVVATTNAILAVSLEAGEVFRYDPTTDVPAPLIHQFPVPSFITDLVAWQDSVSAIIDSSIYSYNTSTNESTQTPLSFNSQFIAAQSEDSVWTLSFDGQLQHFVAGTPAEILGLDTGDIIMLLDFCATADRLIVSGLVTSQGGGRVLVFDTSGQLLEASAAPLHAPTGDGGPLSGAQFQRPLQLLCADDEFTVQDVVGATSYARVVKDDTVRTRVGPIDPPGTAGDFSLAGLPGARALLPIDDNRLLVPTAAGRVASIDVANRRIDAQIGYPASLSPSTQTADARFAVLVDVKGASWNGEELVIADGRAGLKNYDPSPDGGFTRASLQLSQPLFGATAADVALPDPDHILVADAARHCVYVMSRSAGTDETIAGQCGVRGFSGDDGPANAALLFGPDRLALGPDGSIYIGDNGNHRVRRVDPSGTISTVVGDGTTSLAGEGAPARAFPITDIGQMIVDDEGNLVIAAGRGVRVVANTDGDAVADGDDAVRTLWDGTVGTDRYQCLTSIAARGEGYLLIDACRGAGLLLQQSGAAGSP